MKNLMFWLLLCAFPVNAQTKFDKQEFQARRDKLFAQIPGGVAIIFSANSGGAIGNPRQAPDFWYLTGIEEPDAVLIMVESSRKSILYVPKKDENEVMINGPGIWQVADPKETYGLQLASFDFFWITLSNIAAKARTLYLPLTAMDNQDEARDEASFSETQSMRHPVYGKPSTQRETVKRIREWVPQLPVADINPLIDRMRWVKTPYEIERMRMSGKIGAEGVKESIKGTKPGMYENEIEATARYIYRKRGAFDAFPPIVASGPNTITIHYTKNNRQMQAGDVVLIDYGADYDYYESDITRAWPVSGKFDSDQEKMYRCILEARNVIFAAMKPGMTIRRMKAIGDSIYTKNGFKKEYDAWGQYVGHHIGISVHDVSPYDQDRPMEPGVVFNLEPVIENRDKKIHIRLEDTILITDRGAENLTAGVPAELDEIYALIKQKGLSDK